jgi:hypothetical protein
LRTDGIQLSLMQGVNMKKVEIVNTTGKRIVINNLNLVIGPYDPTNPVIKGEEILENPEVIELAGAGMIALRDAGEGPATEPVPRASLTPEKTTTTPKTPKAPAKPRKPRKKAATKTKAAKNAERRRKRKEKAAKAKEEAAQAEAAPKAPTTPSTPAPKVQTPPAPEEAPEPTSFLDPNAPADQMGSKVTIMGESGPEERNMNPGMHAVDGPKYVGDSDPDAPAAAETATDSEFTTIEQE